MMKTILLAGCGNMGTAMLTRWLDEFDDEVNFIVIDPQITPQHPAGRDKRVRLLTQVEDGLPSIDLIVLAMKPQMLNDALPALLGIASPNTVWLSIIAGVTRACLHQTLGDDALIIRTMPNTPAAIGKGMTAMIMDDKIPDEMQNLAEKMMTVIGEVVILHNEEDMDSVTAISGSGPAYIFLLHEAMTSAGINLGLDEDVAKKLAMTTLSGAAALLEESELSAAQLRRNVTSPKGTTEAALNILMAEDGLPNLMTKATLAAQRRARELAEEVSQPKK